MAIRRSKKQIEQPEKIHGNIDRPVLLDSEAGKDSQQPRPKVPLLSGGKDPTLGERFEDELYRS